MRDRALDALLGSLEQPEAAFDALMPKRVSNVLLVSSLYDRFTFMQDGRVQEMLVAEYADLDLRFAPSIETVSTADEALAKLASESFDLVITMPRVGVMNMRDFRRAVSEAAPGLPMALLAPNTRELGQIQSLEPLGDIDRTFVWLGNGTLFLAIIKHIEDRDNAWHDARAAGVKCIILIEDSVQFYSSYLPMLYTEILKQTRALLADDVTRAQKVMRMRARPKVLLATSYEEGARLYEQYHDDLLGVIVDAAFPIAGRVVAEAGLQFARMVRAQTPDVPLLMQSSAQHAQMAARVGARFIDKNSPSLLGDLRAFVQTDLGFGDFVFRGPDQSVVSRVPDLRNLGWAIEAVPADCLLGHLRRNDLARWLRARSEFELVDAFRCCPAEEPRDPEQVRSCLLEALAARQERSRAGVVADFSGRTFDGTSGFVRIGEGSLGGKGRGLAFINSLITEYKLESRFAGVRIFVPPTAVLATGVFDQFLERSGLLSIALKSNDDDAITRAFVEADLPEEVMEQLWTFLDWVRYPLAVRSSSLLEDASYQPFAGIYKTVMIPNNQADPEVRLQELCTAIKMVFASTYHADAKAYIQSTPNRLEEEKMAVIIQQVVGRAHGCCLYPSFAGVGRSLNFYPMPGTTPEDGVVCVALGMGKTVVDGGQCVRFCPTQPRKPIQSFRPREYVDNSQKVFYALDLSLPATGPASPLLAEAGLVSMDLATADQHGTLRPVASVYSADNDAVYDGLGRPGVPIVTMAGVLKGGLFPLAEVTRFLLEMGVAACSCQVEIEFAVNLARSDSGEAHEFAFLQIRPLVLGTSGQDIELERVKPHDAICVAGKVMGNGFLEGIADIVCVRQDTFERSKTPEIASELGELNARLRQAGRRYLLIGPGRWGSADPWLGIPARWSQISGVGCIVETGLQDIVVEASQGSHFFQNITSFGIGYLTVDANRPKDQLDYRWLEGAPAAAQTRHLRHIALSEPLEIALNGRRGLAVVMKPGHSLRDGSTDPDPES